MQNSPRTFPLLLFAVPITKSSFPWSLCVTSLGWAVLDNRPFIYSLVFTESHVMTIWYHISSQHATDRISHILLEVLYITLMREFCISSEIPPMLVCVWPPLDTMYSGKKQTNWSLFFPSKDFCFTLTLDMCHKISPPALPVLSNPGPAFIQKAKVCPEQAFKSPKHLFLKYFHQTNSIWWIYTCWNKNSKVINLKLVTHLKFPKFTYWEIPSRDRAWPLMPGTRTGEPTAVPFNCGPMTFPCTISSNGKCITSIPPQRTNWVTTHQNHHILKGNKESAATKCGPLLFRASGLPRNIFDKTGTGWNVAI